MVASKSLSLFALIGSAAALCPGDSPCSSNGACGIHDKCTCFTGYTGEDCSARTCNHHTSWNQIGKEATTNGGDNTVGAYNLIKHTPTECSSKGDCDRDSGECKCYEGYTGKGCRRMQCDGGSTCSGHGQCRSLGDVAKDNSWTGKDNAGYDGWDKNMVQACKCDAGWAGVACTDRLCPVGDDPLSTSQVDATIFLGTGRYSNDAADGVSNHAPYIDDSTSAAANAADYLVPALEFVLKYTDAYGATWSTWGISAYDTSAIAIEEALEALPNYAIPAVTVTEVHFATGSVGAITMSDTSSTKTPAFTDKIFSIEFTHPRNSGPQTLTVESTGCDTAGCSVYYHGTTHVPANIVVGDPATTNSPLGGGAKIYTKTEAATLTIGSTAAYTATAVEGSKEATTCSGRGSCDSEKGTCECFAGYTGNSCETQTTIV